MTRQRRWSAWLVLALSSCGTRDVSATIELVAALDGHPLTCGTEVDSPSKGRITLRDLRLYAHDISVLGADGQRHPFVLKPGGFQTDQVVLLDFEDGCHNGTPQLHTALVGTTHAKKPWNAVEFTVGVPFELNHADPLRSEGPLSVRSMHWSWQGGYKFLRFDARVNGDNVRYHLGSTGCEGTVGRITACRSPNLGRLRIPLEEARGTLDLAPMLPSQHTTGGCMSAGEADCAPLFAWLTIPQVVR